MVSSGTISCQEKKRGGVKPLKERKVAWEGTQGKGWLFKHKDYKGKKLKEKQKLFNLVVGPILSTQIKVSTTVYFQDAAGVLWCVWTEESELKHKTLKVPCLHWS